MSRRNQGCGWIEEFGDGPADTRWGSRLLFNSMKIKALVVLPNKRENRNRRRVLGGRDVETESKRK